MAMYDEDSMTGLATALVVLRKLDKNLATLVGDADDDADDPYKMMTDKEFTACGLPRLKAIGAGLAPPVAAVEALVAVASVVLV
eukprot:1367210-Prymnesium_polylepis.1